MSFAERLQKVQPKYIWWLVLAIVFASVLAPISLPVPITSTTRKTVAWLDSLPKGSNLFIAPEYGPGPDIELNPQVQQVAIVAFKHGLNIVLGTSGNPLGPELANQAIQNAAAFVTGKACTNPGTAQVACGNIKYGVNWVDIGYKPGNAISENELEQNFQKGAEGVDYFSKPLSSYPLTKNIQGVNSKYFSGLWVEDTGTPGCPDWLANVSIPGNLPEGCGAITMEIPNFAPFVASGQYKAFLGGSRGAGEMEEITGDHGLGLAGQETATLASILILVLVVLGNVAYFQTKNKKSA